MMQQYRNASDESLRTIISHLSIRTRQSYVRPITLTDTNDPYSGIDLEAEGNTEKLGSYGYGGKVILKIFIFGLSLLIFLCFQITCFH